MRSRRLVVSLVLLGVLIVGSAVGHLLVRGPGPSSPLRELTVLLLVGASGIGLLYSARWHADHAAATGHDVRISLWMAGSGLLFVSLGIVSLYVASEHVVPHEIGEILHLNGSVGLVVGVLIGTFQAQAIDNAEAAARAEALEAERRRLEELNDLLRHYILNGVTIIGGYADHLRSAVPPEEREALDTIQSHADTIATLVQNVRTLSGFSPGVRSVTTVDLGRAMDDAVPELQSRPDAIAVDAPDRSPPAVRASPLLGEALALLCDAIDSVTDADGALAIDYEWTAREVTVVLTASSLDVSQSAAASVFEPGGALNLKFYLAKQSIDSYGELRLREAADDTLRLALTLDRPSA